MKIAMLGMRGIPANYSGFETCVEAVSTRLVQRGHQVTVYNRPHHVKWPGATYKGVRLVKIPTIRNKYLETLVHTTLSAIHVSLTGADIVLIFIAANSPVALIPRLAGYKTILHVDGLDWKRDKWPPFAKRYIKLAEWLGTRLPHALITDSRVVQQYYKDTYQADIEYIAYGAEVEAAAGGETLARFGLQPEGYVLFVGRLVPENGIHTLIKAYEQLHTSKKCVIVGNAPYAEKYITELNAMAGPNVIFTGYQFGAAYRELSSNAYLFVEPSKVGGTHPALVEAMGFGSCVVAHGTPENRETIGDAGFSYDGAQPVESLRALLQQLVDEPDLVTAARERSRVRAARQFSWEQVTDAYEAMFRRMLKARRPRPATKGRRPDSGPSV